MSLLVVITFFLYSLLFFVVLLDAKNIFLVLHAWVLDYDCRKQFGTRWLSLRGTDKAIGIKALLDQP